MKVFLSWSGERSHLIAQALRDWLPNVIQALDPWLSSSDIKLGMRWASELQLQLEQSRFGIICLTPENLSAPWILYEAGALSKSLESAFVCPYLFGFSPSELHGPLIQFQATTATKDGTRSLIYTLNRALGDKSIQEARLERIFVLLWPDLEIRFQEIAQITFKKKAPKEETIQEKLANAVIDSKEIHQSTVSLLEELVRRLSAFSSGAEQPAEKMNLPEQRVFIVHGHDNQMKETVARLIERLGLAVIILHEQPNLGRTIIEKFEAQSEVDYVIVLMTADDRGGTKVTDTLHMRARQNVVFELGFFVAKLGRSKVCILYEEGVEMPSDFSGILYIPIDKHGIWRFTLAKELKTAGLRIDLNNAF